MWSHLCPACRSTNRPTARRCEACGAALGDFDTVPSALTASRDPAGGVDSQVGALWFDDLLPHAPPPPALPALPGMTVREIRLGPPGAPAERALRAPASPGPAPGRPASAAAGPAPASPAAAPLPTDRAARAAIKVARRAAVRHARLAGAAPPPVVDVLVTDGDAVARNRLDELLGEFGFHVRPVATLAQAAQLAGCHPFAAVFVAVPPGAVDGAVHDLFEQVLATGRRAGVPPAVRVLLAAQWSPVDRVRAELAGCDATLLKPPGRRDLARVLDAHGVALPRDPRRV